MFHFFSRFFVAFCCQYGRLRINDDLVRAHDNELRSLQGDSRPEFEGSRGRYGGGGGGGGRGRDGDGSYRGKSKGGAGGGRGGADRRDARKNMRNAAHRAVPGFPVSSAFWFFHLGSWLNCPFFVGLLWCLIITIILVFVYFCACALARFCCVSFV